MLFNKTFKNQRSFFIVLFAAFVTTALAEYGTDEKERYICFADYLKSQNMLEKSFRYKSNKTYSEGTQCQSDLEEFRSVFYAEMETELKTDAELSEDVDCLIEQFKKLNLADYSLKKVIYELSKSMSQRKRKKAIKAIDFVLEKRTETAVKLCTFGKVFGGLFNETYASANETDSKEEGVNKTQEDYCMRKYIVDKGFINTTTYNINLNPDKVDILELNCDEIIEKAIDEAVNELKEEFESELEQPSKRAVKCITKTIRTENFFEMNLKVVVLGELGISEESQAEERSQFIEAMKMLFENILKCYITR